MIQGDICSSLIRDGGLVYAPDLSGFDILKQQQSGGVLWDRSLEPGFLHWLANLDPDALPSVRRGLSTHSLHKEIQDEMDEVGLPDGVFRDRLASDVAVLAKRFARIMKARYLRWRFDVIDTNACRRFHQDVVTARLICTYRGPGTQLTLRDDGGAESQIMSIPTGAPIMLRGKLWPATTVQQLLHRSPPIEGTGMTRLVLVLDPVDDPEDI